MKTYKENKERICALITLPILKKETYSRDLEDMLSERLTFNEALNSSTKTIMVRQRLKIIRDQLFNQLDNAVIIE